MRSSTRVLSYIVAWDEFSQYAVSIVSIAAGILLRRSSLPFVHRGELRDLPYLDRSGRSRDRRDHQFPLLSIVDAQAPFAKLWKGYGRGRWANRPSSRIVPPRTVMRYETRTASTATERRAIETIHARYWKFLRHSHSSIFGHANALNLQRNFFGARPSSELRAVKNF
jgi:hypothetical protein